GDFAGRRPPPPPPGEGEGPRPRRNRPRALIVLEIDRAYLANGLVPDLAKRYLSMRDFDIAVISGSDVLYRSNAWPGNDSSRGELRRAEPRRRNREGACAGRALRRDDRE